MSTTESHATNAEIIGRDDIDDIEAILSVSNVDVDEVEHVVRNNADTIFTWDYSLARPQLRKLYEKAKTGQWNATTDLPWDTEVELDEVVTADQAAFAAGLSPDHYAGTVVEKWGDKEWLEFGIDSRRWTLSQFLHGE
ncbi:MAG: ferritin-like domain-containing protein, partial [Ilumatobacteraceae bacterium]